MVPTESSSVSTESWLNLWLFEAARRALMIRVPTHALQNNNVAAQTLNFLEVQKENVEAVVL